MQVYANTTLAGVGFTGASLGVALRVLRLQAGPIWLLMELMQHILTIEL